MRVETGVQRTHNNQIVDLYLSVGRMFFPLGNIVTFQTWAKMSIGKFMLMVLPLNVRSRMRQSVHIRRMT